MCWFTTTLLNMHDIKDVGCDELVALHGHCSVKLQQICLRTWYYSIKYASWSIGNQREKLLDRCPFIRHANEQCETLSVKVSKGAKIRNRYNQVPHLTQDTNGKVTNSQLYTTNESQEGSPFPAGDHKAHINRRAQRHSKHKTEKT